jgi:hypothetical protein
MKKLSFVSAILFVFFSSTLVQANTRILSSVPKEIYGQNKKIFRSELAMVELDQLEFCAHWLKIF